MTSNTTPEGKVFCDSIYDTGFPAYKAFDGILYNTSNNNRWVSVNSGTTHYIGYKFNYPVCVKRVKLESTENGSYFVSLDLEASNDNITWTKIQSFNNDNIENISFDLIVTNNKSYFTSYRVVIHDNNALRYSDVDVLQFYGRQ